MPALIPSATYRLQFNQSFTFRHAQALVPYLARLGVSHVYASPLFRAAPGSVHGYDISSHNELNPEIGTREEFDTLCSALHAQGMGIILDFVPNHMGIGESTNLWWMDILENGPASPYACYFDIDWNPVKRELENKVLLPILGDQYGRVLENGDFKLRFEGGTFCLHYFDRPLPVAPRTIRPLLNEAREVLRAAGQEVPMELDSILLALEHLPLLTDTEPENMILRAKEKEVIKARLARLCQEQPVVHGAIQAAVTSLQDVSSPEAIDRYDRFLSSQPYRLASWKVAGEEINYRRFFDVNSLAAIRMERPEVFEACHKLLFDLVRHPAVQGVRIDHIDGLYDPAAYLVKLQERFASIHDAGSDDRPLYLLVEKILGHGEDLQPAWPVHGTTGYEAGNQITSVLVPPTAEAALTETYAKSTGQDRRYEDIVYESKLLVMRLLMPSEVNTLGQMLDHLSETNRWYRDFTLNSLTDALRQLIACFPVYRTYLVPGQPVSETDARVISRAIAAARRQNPQMDRSLFDFLRDVLLPPADNTHPVDEELRCRFVMKFQQCTGPITAKGVEDTAFYRYNRLIALNEVGGEPQVFGESADTFHQKNIRRLAAWPHSMVATSTHDTKRSEDVRARVAVLAELPQEWAQATRRWRTLNRKHLQEIGGRMAPDANEEYLLYQTLLGSWPLAPMSPAERQDYAQRIEDYMIKAVHEAKVNSGWMDPHSAWEDAVKKFVHTILKPGRQNRFLENFEPLAQRIAQLGMVNALAQTVLKLTIPGVPDIYQGQELWDFSLVDPDNRRAVDYDTRVRLLESLPARDAAAAGGPAALPAAEDASWKPRLEDWQDGRMKLFITQKILAFRRENPLLFQAGAYTPVKVEGAQSECCLAFHRQHEGTSLLVIVPRFTSRVGTPPVGDCWGDTTLVDLPSTCGENEYNDLFTGRNLPSAASLPLAQALAEFPVAMYISRR